MTTDNREKFRQHYRAGKQALERGRYRQSIENLESAVELIAPTSRQGGEAQIWLVTAYQAANSISEAIALAQKLTSHPDSETRQQAKRLLYIIQAPKLSRPKEWLNEIPDLTDADIGKAKYVAAKTNNNKQTINENPAEVNLSEINDRDNKFVWFALLVTILTLSSIIWMSK
ncbi:outer membrane protein assembly factor BamD [Myxosarcina sp. GI1]|uniref:outer membrane protein assembly factor BamD n=1 Tax=Myxosarcina sp. GI1 TaxID=1541065 RepID=UPI0005622E56|nr:outer membrane protein assembly factor BamD [Myxosarcina sp. GI1]